MDNNTALIEELTERRRRVRRLRDQPEWLTALAFGVALTAIGVDAALGDEGWQFPVAAGADAWLVTGAVMIAHRRRFGAPERRHHSLDLSWGISIAMFCGYLALSPVDGDVGTAGQIAVGVVGNAAFGLLFRLRFLIYVSCVVAVGGVLTFTYPAAAWISTAVLGAAWLVLGALSLRHSSRRAPGAATSQS